MLSQPLSVKQKNLLRQHRYILKKLVTSSKKDRKIILENAPSELFHVTKLILKLVANKRLNLTSSQTKKIKKFSSFIRSINTLKGRQLRQKLFKHRESALTAILKAALPALREIFSAA